MASSSSSSSTPIRRYHVYLSYHGPDLPKEFLSDLHNHCTSKGLTTFKDEGVERGQTIRPEFVQAIKESRLSIVVLSKNYASSRWCLDELVEILKCKEASGQIVMTVLHNVAPSDVRRQNGHFGKAFEKTCQGETEEVKKRWSNALTHVGSLRGELSENWDDEAAMFKSIAEDVELLLYKYSKYYKG